MTDVLNTLIENGSVVNSEIHKKAVNDHWLLDGIMYAGKSIFKFITEQGATLEPVFIVVAICGFFLIMAGADVVGKKIVSGSVISYIVCKVCEAAC